MPRAKSTSWANPQLLKSLRDQHGWSQEELAHRAGVSLRVVAKAESGQPIAASTIKSLAEAFCRAGTVVDPRDFIVNTEMLARQFLANYATYQADCVRYSLDILSPDILAVLDGDPDINPIAGEYRGIEEFDQLWKKFFSIFVRTGGTLGDEPETRYVGNEIFAWGHECVHLPGTPDDKPGLVLLQMTFKNGKMTHFIDHYESEGMMRTLEKYCHEFPDAEWARRLLRAEANGK